jgi:phospholipase C
MASTRRIEHVVVLMLENRSFDHMLGYHAGVNGLTGKEFNHWRLVDAKGRVLAKSPIGYDRRAAAIAAIKQARTAASSGQ